MKSFQLNLPSALGLVLFAASLCFSATTQAQTFEGANSSSERIVIQMSSNGLAELAWYPRGAGNLPKREVWLAAPDLNGFRLTAPADSSLKKAGDSITYTLVSTKSTNMHCRSGCAATMPNLIARRAK
jgi:hypothetical protein